MGELANLPHVCLRHVDMRGPVTVVWRVIHERKATKRSGKLLHRTGSHWLAQPARCPGAFLNSLQKVGKKQLHCWPARSLLVTSKDVKKKGCHVWALFSHHDST